MSSYRPPLRRGWRGEQRHKGQGLGAAKTQQRLLAEPGRAGGDSTSLRWHRAAPRGAGGEFN